MRRIWIVGKSGILAKAFSKKCKEENIDFASTSKEEVDVTKIEQVQNFLKNQTFSHIINCSGYTNVEKAEEDVEEAFLLNVTSVKNLAICAEEKKTKLLHFSTDYVFDGKKNSPYKENDSVSALNIYGESKAQGEKILFAHHEKALLIRISWLFGKTGKSFVSVMKDLMQKKEEIKVVQDQIGRVSFAEDVTAASFALLEEEGIFHFANEGTLSWYDFAVAIYEKLCEKKVPLLCKRIIPILSKDYPQKALRPKCSILDTTKIEAKVAVSSYKSALDLCLEEEEILCQKN